MGLKTALNGVKTALNGVKTALNGVKMPWMHEANPIFGALF
jgi:hypothetical protein